MREIKFRAWDLDEKKMVNLGSILHAWACEPLTKRELEAFNFMQYTGLKDKNGTEIYEGDIVEFATSKDQYRGQVEFGKGMYTVKAGLDFYLNEIVERGCEVIGNIMENPDLLERGK